MESIRKLERSARFMCVAAIISVGAASSAVAQSPAPNWRDFQTLSFGRVRAIAQISSARTVRLITAIDNARLIGPDVQLDTVLAWKTRLWNELDNPKQLQYVLGNAFLVQPFATDSATIGYLLTVADTAGESKQAILDKGAIEEFLDLLSNAVTAGKILSDAELHKNAPIVTTQVSLAKPYKAVYPRTAKLVGVSGSALIQFVVDAAGEVKPGSVTTIEATYKDFGDAAASYVTEMAFIPATIDGHAVERLVQYPFDFKLSTVMPITPFQVPVRRTR
ncbi:MAG: TonB family protein [Gemmatimonadaceae bacterium]|nr:TonB family protein [Gemmatimonadaceae bacterium]